MAERTQPPRRAYDSSGRRARADESRRRILGAAHDLFVERGYAGTTMADIAQRAGVSAPTVYATGSKAALLKACIDRALAGDDEPVAVVDRPLVAVGVRHRRRRARCCARYAVMMGELAARAAPIYDVVVRAADAEPEIAELLADLERQRLKAATIVADAVASRGGLPPGRTVEEARDTIWVLNAPELYVTLTRKRRWSTKRYVAWSRNALLQLVAAPSRAVAPVQRYRVRARRSATAARLGVRVEEHEAAGRATVPRGGGDERQAVVEASARPLVPGRAGPAVALEQDDGQLRLHHQAQRWPGSPHDRRRLAGRGRRRRARRHEGVGAVDDEREPQRQPACPPGEVEREVGRVDVVVAEGVEVAGRLAVGAGRPAPGSRYSTAAQSSGANSHLCGSMTTESAALDAGEAPGQLGHGQRGAAVGRVDVQPPAPARRTPSATPARSSMAPVLVAPALTPRRRRSSGRGQRAERVAGEAVGVVARRRRRRRGRAGAAAVRTDEWADARGGDRRGGRRRGGAAATCRGRRPARSGCRPTRRTRSSPPAPSGSPASARSQSSATSSAATAAAGLLPALARERPGADEGVEQRGRRRRRGRDVGEEPPVVEGDVVRQQHVVDERQRLVDARARRA